MEMIDLSRLEPQETLNHTSKGNQLKWKCYGYWYKADHMGYEGLAETIVSALLGKSTVKYPFVAYEYSQIKYKDRVYSGCKSADFLADGYDLIPLEKLYRKFTGGSLAVDTAHQGKIKNQIKFLVNFDSFQLNQLVHEMLHRICRFLSHNSPNVCKQQCKKIYRFLRANWDLFQCNTTSFRIQAFPLCGEQQKRLQKNLSPGSIAYHCIEQGSSALNNSYSCLIGKSRSWKHINPNSFKRLLFVCAIL